MYATYLVGDVSAHARNQHHARGSIVLHDLSSSCLRDQKRAGDVDVEQPLERVGRKLSGRAIIRDAGTCHQAADRKTEALELGKSILHSLRVSYVALIV